MSLGDRDLFIKTPRLNPLVVAWKGTPLPSSSLPPFLHSSSILVEVVVADDDDGDDDNGEGFINNLKLSFVIPLSLSFFRSLLPIYCPVTEEEHRDCRSMTSPLGSKRQLAMMIIWWCNIREETGRDLKH